MFIIVSPWYLALYNHKILVLCSYARFCQSIQIHWQCFWPQCKWSLAKIEEYGPNKSWDGNFSFFNSNTPCISSLHVTNFVVCMSSQVQVGEFIILENVYIANYISRPDILHSWFLAKRKFYLLVTIYLFLRSISLIIMPSLVHESLASNLFVYTFWDF